MKHLGVPRVFLIALALAALYLPLQGGGYECAADHDFTCVNTTPIPEECGYACDHASHCRLKKCCVSQKQVTTVVGAHTGKSGISEYDATCYTDRACKEADENPNPVNDPSCPLGFKYECEAGLLHAHPITVRRASGDSCPP